MFAYAKVMSSRSSSVADDFTSVELDDHEFKNELQRK